MSKPTLDMGDRVGTIECLSLPEGVGFAGTDGGCSMVVKPPPERSELTWPHVALIAVVLGSLYLFARLGAK